MTSRTEIESLVLTVAREMGQDLNVPDLVNADLDTRLYGGKSGVDSFTLVSLITELEQRVEEQFGVSVLLADERAMSRTRSPFRRINTLIEFLESKISEASITDG